MVGISKKVKETSDKKESRPGCQSQDQNGWFQKIVVLFFLLAGLTEGFLAGYLIAGRIYPSVKKQVEAPPQRGTIPQKIIIPRLGIETGILPIGLNEKGEMVMPEDYTNVGWYRDGFRLGEKGSIVIAGHLDSKTGPAVFYRLSQLQPGDEIRVIDQNGREFIFIVTRLQTYYDANFPLEEVFLANDKQRLNLITCRGHFDRAKQRYNQRVVVFSELKE